MVGLVDTAVLVLLGALIAALLWGVRWLDGRNTARARRLSAGIDDIKAARPDEQRLQILIKEAHQAGQQAGYVKAVRTRIAGPRRGQ